MYYADLGTSTQIDCGPHVRAIGWLSAGNEFPRGDVSPAARARLHRFAALWGESSAACQWPVACGRHVCEFCAPIAPNTFIKAAAGNFAVPASEILYVCPQLVAHYVEAHAYLPPQQFIDALLASPLPGTREYAEAVARFPSPWARRFAREK